MDTTINGLVRILRYLIDFPGSQNKHHFISTVCSPGACHSDEMGYLFKINMFPQKLVPGSKDFLMMQTMTKLWTDFAKNGDPTPESRLWTPATASNLACLEIDEELTLQTDRDRSEVEFWKEIHLAEKADSGPVVH